MPGQKDASPILVLLRDGTARAQQNFSRDRHLRSEVSGDGRVIHIYAKQRISEGEF